MNQTPYSKLTLETVGTNGIQDKISVTQECVDPDLPDMARKILIAAGYAPETLCDLLCAGCDYDCEKEYVVKAAPEDPDDWDDLEFLPSNPCINCTESCADTACLEKPDADEDW
jgi:hypothetical protein